jgi:hypothetical protein
MPALLTSTSIFSCRATVPPTSAWSDPASVISAEASSARPPAAKISSTVPCALPPRAAAITIAPRRASSSAIARPMPRDAPVTTATLFSKSRSALMV